MECDEQDSTEYEKSFITIGLDLYFLFLFFRMLNFVGKQGASSAQTFGVVCK